MTADDTQDLLRLADLVEKATGPDRELDAAIYMLLNPHMKPVTGSVGRFYDPQKTTMLGAQKYHIAGGATAVGKSYTASLDAAMTLVPEGWFKLHPDSLKGWAALGIVGPWSHAATPALALCAAALRARAHSTKDSSSHD